MDERDQGGGLFRVGWKFGRIALRQVGVGVWDHKEDQDAQAPERQGLRAPSSRYETPACVREEIPEIVRMDAPELSKNSPEPSKILAKPTKT